MAKDTKKEIRNQVIYQIFTRNYKEGTFNAVKNDLDRIKALGVDIVYLLPVQPSGEVNRKGTVGSPYAIKDYRVTDPMQGTMEEFEDLCNAVRAKGMKIMIDVVYNHTSPDSLLSKTHPEWFFHKEDGSFGNRVGEWWDVIDLDYSNKELWDYQIETLKMWAKYVDGFRCDVAPIIPVEFWMRARAEVEEVRPGCLWMAESVEPIFISICRKMGIPMHTDSEMYQAFDICYDYDIYGDMANVMYGKGSLKTYLDKVNQQETIYPDNYSKLRCLENHDRSRAAAMVPDKKTMLNWTAWNYFAKGTPMIYAGEEYMDAHHPTLFDMDPINFDEEKNISDFLKTLADIRKNDIFIDSSFEAQAIGRNDEIILAVHEAVKKEAKAIGIFSTSGNPQAVKIDLADGTYKNEITGKMMDVFEGTLAFDGNPVIIFA